MVWAALGAIHQRVAYLDCRPEPSYDEELQTIQEQMFRAEEQNPDGLERMWRSRTLLSVQ